MFYHLWKRVVCCSSLSRHVYNDFHTSQFCCIFVWKFSRLSGLIPSFWQNIRIVDYEKMVDSKGQRVCAFGKFAGVGGLCFGCRQSKRTWGRVRGLGHISRWLQQGSVDNQYQVVKFGGFIILDYSRCVTIL